MFKRSLMTALLLGLSALALAGDSYDHHVDEAKNAMGPNRCADDRDCDGKRTCSPWNWCQGVSRPGAKAQPTPPPHPDSPLPVATRELPKTQPGPDAPRPGGALSGHWYGAYGSRKLSEPQTTLEMDLQQTGKELNGRAELSSPARKPGEGSSRVSAPVTGKTRPGKGLRFSIAGDGAPRVFNGTVAKQGDRIAGTWKQGRYAGVFMLMRGQARPTPQPTPTAMAASNADLEGYWDGEWKYDGDIYKPTVFTMALSKKGQGFAGVCDEPNTFPGTKAKNRHSFIQDGVVSTDGVLRWRKQMDGAEGIDHLIDYVGVLSQDHQAASGQWQIPGKNGGTWVIYKTGAPSLIKGTHLLGGGKQPVPTAIPETALAPMPTASTKAAEPTPRPTPTMESEQLLVVDGTPVATQVPTPTKKLTSLVPANPNPAPAPARGLDALYGPWSGTAHPGPKGKGLPVVSLNLVFSGKAPAVGGQGIALVKDAKPRERNVDLMNTSFLEPDKLRFTVHFSEPEEEDLALNFVGILHKNEKLIKGTWDRSGSEQGDFELHYQEGGK